MQAKKLLIIRVVVLAIVITGCVDESPRQEGQSELEESTGQEVDDVEVGGSYKFEVKATEKNQMELVQKRPPIEMGDSLERQNLIERYKYLNDRNNVHHVYLMSNDGKVISYFVA